MNVCTFDQNHAFLLRVLTCRPSIRTLNVLKDILSLSWEEDRGDLGGGSFEHKTPYDGLL